MALGCARTAPGLCFLSAVCLPRRVRTILGQLFAFLHFSGDYIVNVFVIELFYLNSLNIHTTSHASPGSDPSTHDWVLGAGAVQWLSGCTFGWGPD